ncbi:hypothetical protein NPS53_09380 [Pseudomonas putida]|uniref:hypothetical protein n=1 Tax=Pseudomonas putida TaxID=303 RepID=UPI002363CBA0|nr:hypothetical protein [Pseudomonas putida]MDD2139788.1 hypothetical protein [Pseudomonas putida]HDS1721712.1 hypothetical protein [Pseudomonas putida]
MANMPIHEAFKDETYALRFMLESPWHAVVLGRMPEAMQKYQNARTAAMEIGNAGLIQDIELTIRLLRYEASDRLNIKFEYLVIEAFEALHGTGAVNGLLDYQQRVIARQQAMEWDAVPGCLKLLHEFEEAGLSQVLSWGLEGGRANISQQTRLRLARHHLLGLTREAQRAYSRGERHKGWHLQQRCQRARMLIGPLAIIECKSKALTSIKDLHGEAVSRPVLSWVKENTRLQEYEALRDAVQAVKLAPVKPEHVERAMAS